MLKRLLFIMIISANVFALEGIWNDLTTGRNRIGNYPRIIRTLINQEMFHTAVPYVKEYLVSSKKINQQEFDGLLEEVITHVGDRQFVLLPEKYLKRSKSPTIKYLLAKKLLRRRKLTSSLRVLNASIPATHSVKPFALMLEGTISSYKKNYSSAVESFKRCAKKSQSMLHSGLSLQKKRQLMINRDYCLSGIARSLYAAKEFEKAESAYLDVGKDSYIWPELLVEEAWNSFYKGDYNRTLGKLVTYNAPIMKNIFNPEINVLRAMTYLKMCLYPDAVQVVEKFYKRYEVPTRGLRTLLKKGHDLKYYFLLINSYKEGKKYSTNLVNELLGAVLRDPAFLNLYESYINGKSEIKKIKKVSNKRLRRVLTINLKDSLTLQQKLMGSYVKRLLSVSHAQLKKAFMGMSYIKLEVLSKRKEQLYSGSYSYSSNKRGDAKYLNRNEKQYFWSFNGEFWADELGDYVFALKSECGDE